MSLFFLFKNYMAKVALRSTRRHLYRVTQTPPDF